MGVIVNFLAIIIGGIFGLFMGHYFSEKLKNIILECVSVFIMISGIKSALTAEKEIMILIYLVIGTIIGQLIDIDEKIKKLSSFIEKKFTKEENSNEEKSFSKAFANSTILYCVGAMAILGSINSGLMNDNTILNIKSILDGVTAVVLTAIYGIGVIFSSFSVLIYQGIFFIFASKIKFLLSVQTVAELNAVGGFLIFALGINLLFKKEIKIANMLPALFIPVIFSLF